MSDYISFEELRAMSGEQLVNRWSQSLFPFDAASCTNCVTQHKYFICFDGHRDFNNQASALKVAPRARPDELLANLTEIYALRMYFRDLYPSTPEPPVHGEAVQGEPVAEASEERVHPEPVHREREVLVEKT